MDQEFINQLAEKLSKLGTKRPLGFHYVHPFGTVPPDSIQCNGAEYNRSLYSDFFAYATEQGWVKTEAEWQEIASQNNGYCSYYSDGDGSTTFRTPRFAPFMQIAIASGNVGSYHEAGLPNITGSIGYRMTNDRAFHPSISGSFYLDSNYSGNALLWARGSSGASDPLIGFDASLQSNVFGASSTVQPESSEWMICVVVFGVTTNVGSTDIGNVMSAVAQVQAKLPNKLNSTTPHIVDTWSDGQGNWYRIWSDGWIEQSGLDTKERTDGYVISLHTPMSSTNYSIYLSRYKGASHAQEFVQAVTLNSFTLGIVYTYQTRGGVQLCWMVCGY